MRWGFLAGLRAVRRQRRYHPAFRIPPPYWDPAHHTTWQRIIAVLGGASDPSKVGEFVSLLDAELTAAKAHELAHHGDVPTAEALLRRLEQRGTADPYAWDLMARIHAQRGEFAAADRYWQRVQLVDSGDEAAAAGRRGIAAVLAGRYQVRT